MQINSHRGDIKTAVPPYFAKNLPSFSPISLTHRLTPKLPISSPPEYNYTNIIFFWHKFVKKKYKKKYKINL